MAGEYVRVDGPTAEIQRIANAMKDAPSSFRRELPKALSGGAKVIRDSTREKAATMPLPKRGGFNKTYRTAIKNSIVTKTRALATNPTVSVGNQSNSMRSRKGKRVADSLEKGYVRHPVFGDRKVWRDTQTSTEGWFADTAKEHSDEAVHEMSKRMTDLAQRLQWGHDTGIWQ